MLVRRRLAVAFAVAVAAVAVAVVAGTAGAAASGTLLPIAPVEGTQFQGPVAQFDEISHFGEGPPTATINWGDGTPLDAGVVEAGASAGQYVVSGQHTYANPGTVPVTVVLTWENDGQFKTFATGDVRISDAPLTPVPTSFTATVGKQYDGLVGHFTDSDPNGSLQDIAGAVIDWGDGTESPGRVTTDRRGFRVDGTHTYQRAGNFKADVHVFSKAGGSTTIHSTARVLGDPQAAFTVYPARPCANQRILFNASQSRASPGTRITSHSWRFSSRDARGLPPNAETGADPQHRAVFGYSYVEMYLGVEEDGDIIFPDPPVKQYHRPLVVVTLVITDSTGATALKRRKVPFQDDRFRPTKEKPELDCNRGEPFLSGARFVTESDAVRVGSRSGSFGLRLGCRKIADCIVLSAVHLFGTRGSRGIHRGDVIAAGSGLIHAGTRRTITIRLSGAARRLLLLRHRLRGKLVVRTLDADGDRRTIRRLITLRLRRR